MQKANTLWRAGRLDSIQAAVLAYRNNYTQIESSRWFWIYTDTVKEVNGHYSIGKLIIDPEMTYDGRKLGEWRCFYPNGRLCSKGTYSIGAYTMCNGGAPWPSSYYYRSRFWEYHYDNGRMMACGNYVIGKEYMNLSIGSDTMAAPRVNSLWHFYTREGKRMEYNKHLADSLSLRL